MGKSPPVWTLPRLPPLPEAQQLQINTCGSEVNDIISLELRREIRRGMCRNALKTSHVSPCRNLLRIGVGKVSTLKANERRRFLGSDEEMCKIRK